MAIMERSTRFSMLLNLALLLTCGILVWLLLKKQPFDCNDCAGIVRTRIDTIHVKDKTPRLLKHYKPTYVKGIKARKDESGITSTYFTLPENIHACDTIYYYRDSLYEKDNYNLVINDTLINNQITGRSVWFANLQPGIVKTIDRTLKEKPRIYAGAAFTINANYQGKWGLGPAAMVTVPNIGAFSYYYDIKNNAHCGGLFIQLQVKRK